MCDPLNKLGDIALSPCGMIANTFFNDVIEFTSTTDANSELQMIEDGIAWQSDLEFKFHQPEGFKHEQCDDCDDCECTMPDWSCKEKYQDKKTGKCSRYFYPNDNTTQYLYETYPMISPLEGVTNEHFVVWMRIAAQPKFRKLYGFFDKDIAAGQTLSFTVQPNWIVKTFRGSKTLMITTTSVFGGKNLQFGNSFIVVGGFCGICAFFFAMKHTFKPRRLADDKYLKYKVE